MIKESKDFANFNRPKLHLNGLIVHGHFVMISMSDPNVKKDSSGTIDIIAAALTKLHKKGVILKNMHVVLQLDNTSRENKNNPVLKFLAAAACCRLVQSASARFLMTGHTHEDIDQMFGQLATCLARQGTLETPSDFMRTIHSWLNSIQRGHEPHRYIEYVNNTHAWKDYLDKMDVHVTGIGGPGAPHEFKFERYEGHEGI